MPSIEMVRFTNSGSEAVGTAVRLARAFTGRRILVRFEGHYHGWQDVVYWSNHVDPAAAGPAERPRPVAAGPGVPLELADTLEVLTWNDPESFQRLMDERGDEIAAVITEPAVFNTGCILPEPGYLELLRAETRKHGALLIFDEVITGFRFCRGGGQEWFGVMPDLTTLAKGLGGGFPVAAIGGTREVMGMIAEGRYSHSGTYNANVVQCAAVSATMDLLDDPDWYARQRALGDRLAAGLRDLCAEAGIPARVEGLGTVFQLWFTDHAIRDWREADAYADEALFTRWYQEMLLRGVLFHPSQYENLFVSMVHTDEDIDRTLEAAREAIPVDRRGAAAEEAAVGLLDATPPQETPAMSGRRPLRYQRVIDLDRRDHPHAGPAARQPAADAEGAGGAGRRQPDHRPPSAGRARAGGPGRRAPGRGHLRRPAADRLRAGAPRRPARHLRRARRRG